MDAVCYAEHSRETELMKTAYFLELAKTHSDYQDQQAKQQEDERKRRSMRAEQLNLARHKKTNEAKAIAIKEWEKEPTKFPSAAKAGNYFSNWLKAKGFDYEPRTVTDWFLAAAKERNIRFR